MRWRTFLRRTAITVGTVLVLAIGGIAYLIYDRHSYDALLAAVEQSADRRQDPLLGYTDYKGVVHVHGHLSKDSDGTQQQMVEAAKRAALQFIFLTDHYTPEVFASPEFVGWHDGVLLIRGAEFLVEDQWILGVGIGGPIRPDGLTTRQLVQEIKTRGGLAVIAHPWQFKGWDVEVDGIEAMEIYDSADVFYSRAWRIPGVLTELALWPGRTRPENFFMELAYARQDSYMARYDQLLNAGRKIVAVAGNDAHQNVSVFNYQIDPYETSFKFVQTHLLATSLSKQSLVQALRSGHSYISFGILGDATGFQYYARAGKIVGIMGDCVPQLDDLTLNVRLPRSGRIRLFRNGAVVQDTVGPTLDLPVHERGVYRAEVSVSIAGKDYLWIISNPISVGSSCPS